MTRRSLPCLLLPGLLAALPGPSAAGEPTVDFNRDVRPILSKNCFACHGQDAAGRQDGAGAG